MQDTGMDHAGDGEEDGQEENRVLSGPDRDQLSANGLCTKSPVALILSHSHRGFSPVTCAPSESQKPFKRFLLNSRRSSHRAKAAVRMRVRNRCRRYFLCKARQMRRMKKLWEERGYDGLFDRRSERCSPKRVPMAFDKQGCRKYCACMTRSIRTSTSRMITSN